MSLSLMVVAGMAAVGMVAAATVEGMVAATAEDFMAVAVGAAEAIEVVVDTEAA